MAMVASGCYYQLAWAAEINGDDVPWFCEPTAYNTVVGFGMGSEDFYAGTSRGALNYADCKALAAQLDQVQAFADLHATRGAGEAAGYNETFFRIPGMGTHHGLGVLTPADFADPTFDPHNPYTHMSSGLPGHVDGVFEPGKPEFMQYDGGSASSPLVGMSYYVYTDTGLPPEGFAGNNDWWHHHPTLCHDPATAIASLGVNTTDAVCAGRGGINVHLEDFYMLHVWVVPDVELHSDVYAPLHPCIGGASTIFDMEDPCHDNPPIPGGPGAPVPAGASAGGVDHQFFCPIGQIELQWQAQEG